MIIAKKSYVTSLFLSIAGSYIIPVAASTAVDEVTNTPSMLPSNAPTECVDEQGWRSGPNAHAYNCSKTSSNPSSSPSAAPSLCFNDPDWKFYGNNGCEVVEDAVAEMSDFCDFIEHIVYYNKTAKQACCICKGFYAYEMPSTMPSENVSFDFL